MSESRTEETFDAVLAEMQTGLRVLARCLGARIGHRRAWRSYTPQQRRAILWHAARSALADRDDRASSFDIAPEDVPHPLDWEE